MILLMLEQQVFDFYLEGGDLQVVGAEDVDAFQVFQGLLELVLLSGGARTFL